MKHAAFVRYQQQHLRRRLSILFRFCRREGIEVSVVPDPHKWIQKSEIKKKNDKIKRKNMILGFIPQFESNKFKKNIPERTVDKKGSGKKVNELSEISHQIIVTSKRKILNLSSLMKSGITWQKNSIATTAFTRMKILQMESRGVS